MVTTSIARKDDGTIQFNFSIPKAEIDKAQEVALAELAKDVTVAGFRKGKAPIDKVKERIDPGKLLEKTLGQILPEAYSKALMDNKIKPIIYPKFQILKQGETNWEIQAEIAEVPEIDLGDYKNVVSGAIRAISLKEEPTQQQKEDIVLKTLIETIKIKLAKILIDEEVNARLSQLLERTEKLGLKLEQYLASIGKTETTLRAEYEKQVSDGIAIELILNKIAITEGTEVSENDVTEAIKQAGVTETHEGHVDEQKALVRAVLKRRAALNNLTKLK